MDATGPYQHCRPLTDEEYAALKEDIRLNGIQEYVHVDENGEILVGHHRARAAGELALEYPRHVVNGLSEREKHEYAVRLESLGRARDITTKKYTAESLWRAGLKLQQAHIASLVGVSTHTMVAWGKEWKAADAARAAAEPEIEELNFTPPEPERAENARGQQRPTSYRTSQPTPPEPVGEPLGQRRPNANGAVNGTAASAAAGPRATEREPDARQKAVHPPTPTGGPTLAEIMGDEPFDDDGLAEAEAARKRFNAATFVQVSLMRLVQAHGPEIMVEGERPEELPVLIAILDQVIDWLVRARALAADPRARIRSVAP